MAKPEGDPIDLNHLDQYVAGDAALMDEILSIFIEQAEGWATKLAPYLEDEVWHDSCHALKGASRGVGAWALGDLAEKGERLKGEDVDVARLDLIQKIRREVAVATNFAIDLRDSRS